MKIGLFWVKYGWILLLDSILILSNGGISCGTFIRFLGIADGF